MANKAFDAWFKFCVDRCSNLDTNIYLMRETHCWLSKLHKGKTFLMVRPLRVNQRYTF